MDFHALFLLQTSAPLPRFIVMHCAGPSRAFFFHLFIVLVFVVVVVVVTIFIIAVVILLLLLLSLPSSSLFVSIVFNWPLQEFTFPMSLLLLKSFRLNKPMFQWLSGSDTAGLRPLLVFIAYQSLLFSHIHADTPTCYLDSCMNIRCVTFHLI